MVSHFRLCAPEYTLPSGTCNKPSGTSTYYRRPRGLTNDVRVGTIRSTISIKLSTQSAVIGRHLFSALGFKTHNLATRDQVDENCKSDEGQSGQGDLVIDCR